MIHTSFLIFKLWIGSSVAATSHTSKLTIQVGDNLWLKTRIVNNIDYVDVSKSDISKTKIKFWVETDF